MVPKPDDWDEYINVTGYFFLNEGVRGSYQPPKELADFLAAGPPPVYLGEADFEVIGFKNTSKAGL